MYFRAFTFGVAGSVGVALGIWVIDRDPPVVFYSQQAEASAEPGGSLRILNKVHRFRDCSAHMDRFIIDSAKTRFELPGFDAAKPPGPLGDDEYALEIFVPPTARDGDATFRYISEFKCNLIHRWFWPIVVGPVDVPFEIRRVP